VRQREHWVHLGTPRSGGDKSGSASDKSGIANDKPRSAGDKSGSTSNHTRV